MPKEEEKGPGFSRSHMHLIPVHQWQGDNDAKKSHGGHSMSNQHKKSLPPLIWTKIGSYTVSVESLTHSEFQLSMLYGFRVRARRKIHF